MHRCWLEALIPPMIGDTVAISASESAHMLKALRLKAGDSVQLIAAERLYLTNIERVQDGLVWVRLTEELASPEPVVRMTLLQGLPKADKLEWIVQKATELGVCRVQPVEMTRSVARINAKEAHKRERLQRIALEAAKQAGRAHVPEVLPAMRLPDALKALTGDIYIAWEEETSLRLSEAILRDHPRELTLVIGPEGGIAPDEIKTLKALGAKTVTLGKRILRTETAGVCALAVTLAALGEL